MSLLTQYKNVHHLLGHHCPNVPVEIDCYRTKPCPEHCATDPAVHAHTCKTHLYDAMATQTRDIHSTLSQYRVTKIFVKHGYSGVLDSTAMMCETLGVVGGRPDASVVHASGTRQLQANPPVAGLRIPPGKPTRRKVTTMAANCLVIGKYHLLTPGCQRQTSWQTGR